MTYLNEIVHGDNEDILPRLESNSIDLIVTSPPYDDLRTYNGSSVFNLEVVAKEILRILKPGGVCVWVVGDAVVDGSESGTSFKQALHFKDIGFRIHDTMIYDKKSAPYPAHNRYNQVFEYMFVFSKDQPKTFNPIKDKKNAWAGSDGPGGQRQKDGSCKKNLVRSEIKPFGMRNNIWTYSPGFMKSTQYEDAYEHPAIFPEQLAIDHILSWSNEGDVVLDPFSGSGTTCVCAKRTNRQYIGIEKNYEYWELSLERIKAQSNISLFLEEENTFDKSSSEMVDSDNIKTD